MSNQTSEETHRILQIEDAAQRRREIALQASQIGVFEFEPATGTTFWDSRVRELWGVGPDVDTNYELVIEAVHPKDRVMHDQTTELAIDPNGSGRMDMTYRLFPYDGSPMRWVRAVAHCSFEGDVPVRLVGTVQDVTNEQEQIERNGILLHELEHRVKNTLAIAVAVIELSRSGHEDVESFANLVSARLRSMGLSHEALRRGRWTDASLRACVEREVVNFVGTKGGRFTMAGPDVRVPASNVLTLSMAVHELFTNAAKYGALAVPDGTVEVVIDISSEAATLSWTERNGPTVAPPAERGGFGKVLLNEILPAETGAIVVQTFTPEGLRCEITLPESWAVST